MAKVLLVVGNGFDRKCELKSGFDEFLSSDFYSGKITSLKSLDQTIINLLSDPAYNGNYKIYDNSLFHNIDFNDLSFWDLYFGLPHIYQTPNIKLWYNFEQRIHSFINSIESPKGELQDIINIQNAKVKARYKTDDHYKRLLLLYIFIEKSIGFDNSDKLSLFFYTELKRYEKLFGKYIYSIQHNSTNYTSNAKAIISSLLDKNNNDEVSYINTFNYSDLSFINKDIWHINGDYDMPIFGVDYPEIGPEKINKYRFTKTYRRLELTGKDSYYPKQKDFGKVVVFGHSLTPQDYSYFFSLFNSLKFGTDRNGNRRGYYIEFAYSPHAGITSVKKREETISAVLNMFYKYNQEILHEVNFRLIDILFSTGALRFKEIN